MNQYRVTKQILSGTFSGMYRTEITNVPFEVGFKCDAWAYGPAYIVTECEPYDETKELHNMLIQAAKTLAILAKKYHTTYAGQDPASIDAESSFSDDSATLVDAAKRLIEREHSFWKHLDGR